MVDLADMLVMQNWAHVSTVFARLTALPKSLHDADISRVRPWYLEGAARAPEGIFLVY